MDAQYFIYTRGYLTENDYKLMYYPSDDFCGEDIRKFFRNQAKGAINTEKYYGSLENPRWLFSRYKGMILWGMAIMNKMLCSDSSSDSTDNTGREVRGFFGMIVKDGTYETLPFDINYFKRMYTELVIPYWSSTRDTFRHGGISVSQDFSDFETITSTSELSSLLNSDLERTVILDDSYSDKEYFCSAIGTDKDISLITNLYEREHAFDHSFYYCNAKVAGVHQREEKIYPVSLNSHKVDHKKDIIVEDNTDLTKVEQPKKELRPRVIRTILVVAFIVLTAMLVKKCKNSLSGEQTMKEQIELTGSMKSVIKLSRNRLTTMTRYY